VPYVARPARGQQMISWEVMRDLAQVSMLITGWALFVGSGIAGLTVAVLVFGWVIDQIRRTFRDL
jgi:hypothetical protein